jgi:hypothetical protein
VNANAYARGMGDSGATLKALQQRGNDVAAQSFNGYIQNLQNISQQGTTAASSLAGVSTNYVGQVSSNNNNASDAAGNAQLTSGAAWTNALQNVANSAAYAYGSSYNPKPGYMAGGGTANYFQSNPFGGR